jgi:Ca-activated chloride channel family protein
MGSLPDGTAIGLGLGTAVARLRNSEADSKVVVLVTDGSNNTGQLDPVNAAEMAAELDITVHTVLVGRWEVPVPVPVPRSEDRQGEPSGAADGDGDQPRAPGGARPDHRGQLVQGA